MDPFIGEIRVFAGNFAPKDWALCNGQLLSIQQNSALYSILGVRYGGDGKTTFALPNLLGRVPIHQGAGPGLTARTIGASGGQSQETLNTTHLPAHKHIAKAQKTVAASSTNPENKVWSVTNPGRTGVALFANNANAQMKPDALQVAGGSQPHNNMQPYLAVNYIIALRGIFPSRP